MTEIQLPLHQSHQKGMNGKFLPKNTLEIRGGGVGNTSLTSGELGKPNSAKKSLKLLEKSPSNLTNIQVYPIKLSSNAEKLDSFGTILSVNFIDVKSSTAREPTTNSMATERTEPEEPNLDTQLQMINNNQSGLNNPNWNDESHSGWTSTGVMSDRSSVYSIDDGDFDREASRKVGNQLKAIESVLYEQKSTDSLYLSECKEWLEKFPHLRILGNQISTQQKEENFDLNRSYRSSNKNTAPFLNNLSINDPSYDNVKRKDSIEASHGLQLNGQRMTIRKLEDKELNEKSEDFEFLQEEIFDEDGTYEELFAYDNQEEEYLFEHNKRLNINKRRKHGLPPITPKASMKDLVTSFLFDHMWSELIDWSMDLIRDYAKYVHDKEFCYDVLNRTPVPEQKAATPPKIELINENDKTITNSTSYTRPSIVQLKLFDTPVNTSSLSTLNSDKMSEKQSFTPGLSRDNSILYQNRVASSNYDGLLESKFGYTDSVSTVGDLMPSNLNLKELLRIKQLNKNAPNTGKNLAPIVNGRIGSGSRRPVQNAPKKRYSSVDISSNPLLDHKNKLPGANLTKSNVDDKNINNSLIINSLVPINLNTIHVNRSINNSIQTYHHSSIDAHNNSYDTDYTEYNFQNFNENNENSIDEINVLQNNQTNANYSRNLYLNNHVKKNIIDSHPQLPPIGSSLTMKPLRINSANNFKAAKEKNERPLTSTAPRHEYSALNKRSTTPSSAKGLNSFYPSNMRITGTKFNSEDNNYYQSNNPVNSLNNFLSTKSFGTMNPNAGPNSQSGSNRRNSIKDSVQGVQRINK